MKFILLKKDLKLFFTNKKAVVLTFLIPILLITLFAFAFGGIGQKTRDLKPIEILYSDLDNSSFSEKVIKKLDSIKELNMILTDKLEAEDALRKGKNVGFIIIDKGFEEAIKSGINLPVIFKYDAARPMEYGIAKSLIAGVILSEQGNQSQKNSINTYLNKNFSQLSQNQKNIIKNDISKSQNTNGTNSVPFKEISIVKEETKNKNLGLIQAVAGTAIMMLLFSMTGVGAGLLEEKEAGTLKRLLYAPIKKTDILYGKMGATYIISFIQLSIMFVFAWIAFELPIFKDLPSLILLTLAVAFAVTSFGMFLVAISKSRQQLQNLSTIIILVMSAIGGSMIPIFIMPSFMQKMAVISLNYWGIQGYFDIFWRELSLVEILPKIAILLGIGTIMILISIPLFKKNIAGFTN